MYHIYINSAAVHHMVMVRCVVRVSHAHPGALGIARHATAQEPAATWKQSVLATISRVPSSHPVRAAARLSLIVNARIECDVEALLILIAEHSHVGNRLIKLHLIHTLGRVPVNKSLGTKKDTHTRVQVGGKRISPSVKPRSDLGKKQTKATLVRSMHAH